MKYLLLILTLSNFIACKEKKEASVLKEKGITPPCVNTDSNFHVQIRHMMNKPGVVVIEFTNDNWITKESVKELGGMYRVFLIPEDQKEAERIATSLSCYSECRRYNDSVSAPLPVKIVY